jgi:hypothetical protein
MPVTGRSQYGKVIHYNMAIFATKKKKTKHLAQMFFRSRQARAEDSRRDCRVLKVKTPNVDMLR